MPLSKVTSQTNVLSNDALRALVVRLLPKWRLQDIGRFCHLPGGYNNRNYSFTYQLQSYVLRVPGGGDANFSVEQCWLTTWAKGFAPDIVAFDIKQGSLITKFIDLPLLAETRVKAANLGAFLQHFHQSFAASENYPVYKLNDLIASWLADSRPNPKLALAFASAIWPLTELAVCHNDLNPWNILIVNQAPQRWRVLDWEVAGLNDPLFDLVCLQEGVAEYVDLATLIRGYYRDSAQEKFPDEKRIAAALRLFWFREYAWAIHQIESGNDIPAIQAQAVRFENRLLQSIF